MKAYYFNPQTGEVRVVDDAIEVPPAGWKFASKLVDPVPVSTGTQITQAGDDAIPTYRVEVETVVWEPWFYAALIILALILWQGAR